MNDEEFFAKLLTTFRIEAEEHIKALSDGLLSLENNLPQEERKQKIEHIFREAHSLKGAARAVNQHPVEKICQKLETVLAAWKQEKLIPTAKDFNVLYHTLDAVSAAIATPPDQETLAKILVKLEEMITPTSSIDPLPLLSPSENPKKLEKENQLDISQVKESQKISSETEEKINQTEPLENLPSKEENKLNSGLTENKSNLSKEVLKEKFIRVSVTKLNQLFQEAEELLMVKLISQQQLFNLKQLSIKQHLYEKELTRLLSEIQTLRRAFGHDSAVYQPESVKKMISFFDHQQKEIKFSRENLHKFIKVSEQNTHFVESIVDNLLEDMKKVLMQPLNTLFEAMPRMIRNIAQELGKDIRVEFQGGEIEVDRRILEEIKDPFIHLIRNAIDHGIESPTERTNMDKPSYGTIKIIAFESHGNSVALSIIDDGRGMNIHKLKDVATQQGLLSSKEAGELTEEEVIKLAFHSGISTSPIVTELSGRGLGLGIVSEKVDRLGGQVLVESKLKQGTKFTLVLPLTLATFRGIQIRVSQQDFVMPTHNVKRVVRIQKEDIRTVANCETILVDHRSIPYIHLADLLGLPRNDQKDKHYLFVLIISATEKTIAFGADDIFREQEVLVKGLGKQCIRVKNIMASTVMESGDVIPILNPIDLIRSSVKGRINNIKTTDQQEEIHQVQKEIMLAEDSITTRLLLKNILESAGYAVKIAVDGLEAFEYLCHQSVDLLLTDVEMPRMDGFTLVEKVRQLENIKDIPIIICTSRGSKEDRERGIELGANAYLDKSRFTQQELVGILKKLL